MADLLRESGADTSLLREVDGPSGHAVIEINAAGQNRIIVFGGANGRETREYIERMLDTAQPDDWVLLQNEVNLVPEIIRRAHEKGLRWCSIRLPCRKTSMHCRLRASACLW